VKQVLKGPNKNIQELIFRLIEKDPKLLMGKFRR